MCGRRVKQTIGSALASYVLGGTQLLSQTRGSTTSYFLQDGQGNTRALTNGSGIVTDTYSYTAFGEIFNQTGSTTNSYLYTGQQYDSLTGLYSLRARYYNPALGRFLSQDTYPYNFSNPIELNRYVYTANSPINGMDPSGHGVVESLQILLYRTSAAITASYFVVRAYYTLTSYILQLAPYTDEILQWFRAVQLTYQVGSNIISGWQSGPPWGSGGGGGGDDGGNGGDEPDFHIEVGNSDCDIDCQQTLQGIFVAATTLDSIATGLNFGYALVADIGLFIGGPAAYATMLIAYRGLSVVPNLIGSAGGALWIYSGFLSGENHFEMTVDDGIVDVSGSIAQDTIAAVVFDGLGWSPLAADPNVATGINAAGVIYDIARNPFDPMLPTFLQPTFSFTIDTNNLGIP